MRTATRSSRCLLYTSQALFSIGLVLFVFIMIVNISFTILSKRGVKIDGKE